MDLRSTTPAPHPPGSLSERLLLDPGLQLRFLIFFAVILFFSKLDANDLPHWDDAYYAQKAKEIGQTGDWLTMHYNGQPRFDNPPFYMWLVAISYQAFGVTEYAARFPSALLGVGTVVLLYCFARYLYSPWIGFLAGFILSISLPFARYARRAMVDVTLTFFVCLSLAALVWALEKDRRYFLLWGVSIALGVLTKSVLGLFPLVITVLYLLATKQAKFFTDRYFLLGLFTLLLLGGWWYAHQYANFGHAFLDVHLRWLIWERAFLLPPQPWYARFYYLKELALQYWLWFPLLVLAIPNFARKAWHGEPRARLLLLWVFTYLLILSSVQSKSPWYILPIYPAAAVMGSVALDDWLTRRGHLLVAKACWGACLVGLVVINATPLQLSPPRETAVRALAPYVRHFAAHRARVIAFRINPVGLWGLNNALLFYSDHGAGPSLETYSELAEAFSAETPVLCVLTRPELDPLLQNVSGIFVIKKTDKWVLIANQRLETSDIRTW